MTRRRIDWEDLDRRHPSPLLQALSPLFADGGPFEITAETLAGESGRSTDEAEALLSALCPPLERVPLLTCPNCGTVLSDDEAELEVCPTCHQQYIEHGGPKSCNIFVYHAARTRDVVWVLALHGMNTDGAWQEEFSWRVSTAYGRSVPVAIYKYGRVRPGAIWRPSLRHKVSQLVDRISRLNGDAKGGGFEGPPDVIAHSLGTWLIGHALLWNPSVRVGRILLTGSILRPTFDWGQLIARGQVEAVLNHYGSKDSWAKLAHFAIPDSGPSGWRGFNMGIDVAQVRAEGFGHSDFFRPTNLNSVFETVWRPFLRGQAAIHASTTENQNQWRPWPWVFRATIFPLVLLAAFWGVLIMLACSCVFGIYEGWLLLLGS